MNEEDSSLSFSVCQSRFQQQRSTTRANATKTCFIHNAGWQAQDKFAWKLYEDWKHNWYCRLSYTNRYRIYNGNEFNEYEKWNVGWRQGTGRRAEEYLQRLREFQQPTRQLVNSFCAISPLFADVINDKLFIVMGLLFDAIRTKFSWMNSIFLFVCQCLSVDDVASRKYNASGRMRNHNVNIYSMMGLWIVGNRSEWEDVSGLMTKNHAVTNGERSNMIVLIQEAAVLLQIDHIVHDYMNIQLPLVFPQSRHSIENELNIHLQLSCISGQMQYSCNWVFHIRIDGNGN